MAKLTKQLIEAQLVDTHNVESWARAITEMVLQAARAQLADGSAEEVVIDSQFRVSAVAAEVTSTEGRASSRHCVQVCVVISPTGQKVCYCKDLLM